MEEGDKGKKNMSERKGVKGEDMKESIAHCLKEKRTVYDWKANEYLLVMAIVQMHWKINQQPQAFKTMNMWEQWVWW